MKSKPHMFLTTKFYNGDVILGVDDGLYYIQKFNSAIVQYCAAEMEELYKYKPN